MANEKDVSELEPFIRDFDEEQQRIKAKISSKFGYKNILCHFVLIGLYTVVFFILRKSDNQRHVLLSDGKYETSWPGSPN
jgi:hypothetical protein